MDYGKAFSYIFNDKNWIGVILIGGGLGLLGLFLVWTLIVPLLVGALFYGYMMQLIRDVRYNPDAHLPEWTDWGKKLADGFKLIIVQFIWGLPILLLSMPILFFVVLLMIYPDSTVLSVLTALTSFVMSILILVYGILLIFLLPAVTVNLAVQEDFSAGLDVSTIFHIVKSHFLDILLIVILLAIVGFAANWVGTLIFFIGVVFTGFWVMLVKGHLYGQLARLALPVADESATEITTPTETKPVPATN
jgi:MFS family permease